jgi:Fe-S oxidoreductase
MRARHWTVKACYAALMSLGLQQIAFAIFFGASMAIFARSVWRLVRLIRLGKDKEGSEFRDQVDRIGDLLYVGFGQKRVVHEKFGWNHVIFFWAFVVITIGHGEFILRGIIPSFNLHFMGDFIYASLTRAADVMAFVVLFAVVAALFRRIVVKPRYIDYRSTDAFLILSLIAGVMFTYFLSMGAGIRANHPAVADIAEWMPVSRIVAGWDGLGEPAAARIFYEFFWWAHAAVLMYFLNYIPHSKHVHLIGALPNIYLRERDKPKGALATIDFEKSESFGVGKIFDFNWKQLLDPYACTECGRCDLFCPANNTQKPLKPQKVIHDMKYNLQINGDDVLATRGIFAFQRAPDGFEPKLPLIAESEETAKPGQVSPEVLWACTTCGACVQACPVLIEHVDAILDMRRYLSMTQGAISAELAMTYKNIENNYNPWGIGHDKRSAWADGMGMRFWGSSEDATKYEYLFWVGCAGSFDNRAQKTVRAFTRVLEAAGITYAILGEREKCTGDPMRRTGNEYGFAELANENVATLNDLGVNRIITACPHCLNALKNEYPAFGGHYEVLHHTQLIAKLIDEGRLILNEDIVRRVTFHDPCYLGRWNDEYEAPRRSLSAMRHLQVVEMELTKDRSFCCGAGGGNMWQEEKIGTRVNIERTRQALETEPDAIGVACPFCMTMLEDGVKAANKEEEVDVLDIAEIVANALTAPGLVEQAKPKLEAADGQARTRVEAAV